MKQHSGGYLALARSGELAHRVSQLTALLSECTVCPHRCGVDRRHDLGLCSTGVATQVAAWTPHFGEEPLISGEHGSGAVFLANCNLRCRFCQNHHISQGARTGSQVCRATDSSEVAEAFLELARRGCHNINWVSPSHQVPQLTRALEMAARRGLTLPVVYNSNAYDSPQVLSLLDGVVDVYLPDLKYADADTAWELSGITDYPRHARAALCEMFGQVGDRWLLGPDQTLLRGMLIRILVLPNDLAGVAESLAWIAAELSPRVGISLMAQYYPAHHAVRPGRYQLLERRISAGEWGRALQDLEQHMAGDHHWVQDPQTAPAYYQPDFSDPETPFRDIDDFQLGRRDGL